MPDILRKEEKKKKEEEEKEDEQIKRRNPTGSISRTVQTKNDHQILKPSVSNPHCKTSEEESTQCFSNPVITMERS